MTSLDLRTIARVLGGDVGRDSVSAPGPGHSPRDRSLSIRLDPRSSIGLKIKSFSPSDDWQTCVDHVCSKLNISRAPAVPHLDTSEFALKIWRETVEARGTLAERYLKSRGLDIPDNCNRVIRFHPSCPFGKGTRHPCMVSLYRHIITNEPRAVHRTALTRDGAKIDRKALGPKSGCAIKLTPDEDVAEGLAIGEGVETWLAGMALGFRPCWALGDAGSIAKFPILGGIECLTILVDRDANGTGQASANECSDRWTREGREVFRVTPVKVGNDMADVIRGRAA
jgi:hypothetical protein